MATGLQHTMSNSTKPAVGPQGKHAEESEGIDFSELREGRCKFPLGSINDPPERFCGEPTEIGKAYCPKCQSKAFSRIERRR